MRVSFFNEFQRISPPVSRLMGVMEGPEINAGSKTDRDPTTNDPGGKDACENTKRRVTRNDTHSYISHRQITTHIVLPNQFEVVVLEAKFLLPPLFVT